MPLAKAFAAIAAMALVTFGLRAFPFIFFRKRTPPAALMFVRDAIPPAVMTILALASFKDIKWAAAPHGIPELIAAVAVALLHLWKRNALLSIFGGTALYMIMIRSGVVGLLFGG